MASGVDGAELVGAMRRKKNVHGIFEDPWKAKVVLTLRMGH